MAEEGVVAGRLEIPVESNTKGFGERLKAALKKETEGIAAKIGIEFEEEGLRKRLETVVDAAAAGVKAHIGVEVDTAKARAEIKKLALEKKNQIDYPVKADRKGFLRSMLEARVEAQAAVKKKPIEIPIEAPHSGRGAFFPLLILGVLSLIQPAIAAIGGSIGGLLAMIGNLASGVQVLAAAPGLLMAVVGGFSAVKIAVSALKGPAEDLPKSLRGIRKELDGLKKPWDHLKLDVATKFWGQLNGQIKSTGKVALPVLSTALQAFSKTMGSTTKDLLTWMRTPLFTKQFKAVAADSNSVLGSMGKALLGVAKGVGNIAAAATLSVGGKHSLMDRLASGIERIGSWAEKIAKPGAQAKAFAKELGYAADKAGQLWQMLKDLGAGIKGVFKAARGSGDSLLGSLEKTITKWRDWVESVKGQNAIKKWFDDVEPITREAGSLIARITKGIIKLADDPSTAGLIKELRTQVVPLLGKFLNNLGTSLGPKVISFFTELLEVLTEMSDAGSPLAVGLGYITEALGALSDLLRANPALAKTLGTLLGALLAFRALAFIGNVTGINTMLSGLNAALSGGGLKTLGPLAITIGVFAGALQGFSPAVQGAVAALGTLLTLRSSIPMMQGMMAGLSSAFETVRLKAMYAADGYQAAGAKMGLKGGFATAAGAIGTTARAGLRGALTGLMTLITGGAAGGPVGLAIAGATIAVGLWAQKHAEAAQKAQEYKAYVDRIVESLDKETGALTDATRAEVAKELQRNGAAAAAQKYGVALRDLASAAMGNADAQSRVSAALRASIADTALATDKTGLFKAALSEAGVSQKELESALFNGGTELEKVTAKLDKAAGGNAAMQAAIDRAIRAAVTQTKGQRDLHNQVISSTNAIKDASARQAVFNALMDKAGDEVRNVTSALAKLPAGKTVTVKSLTADAEAKLRAMGYKVEHLPNGTVRISASTKAAEAALNYLARSRTAHIQAVITGPGKAMTGGLTRADGGIVKFANGGLWEGLGNRLKTFARGAERHIAQIARPGEWRLWAEPETGGEAYIPLAPSKRARSLEVLKAVAEQFGMMVAPRVSAIASALEGQTSRMGQLAAFAGAPLSTAALMPAPRGGGGITFEEGAIQVINPAQETVSESVVNVTRKVGALGLFDQEG